MRAQAVNPDKITVELRMHEPLEDSYIAIAADSPTQDRFSFLLRDMKQAHTLANDILAALKEYETNPRNSLETT